MTGNHFYAKVPPSYNSNSSDFSVLPRRVSMFAENMRDGFEMDPIKVQVHPLYDYKYRVLDGAQRWHACKEIGATEIPVHIITLDGIDPLLYAAPKAMDPLHLTIEETYFAQLLATLYGLDQAK